MPRKPNWTRAGDGVQNAFVDNFVNNRPKGTKLQSGSGRGDGMNRAKGGMISKKGYAKGGMVSCGASNPATQKGTPKK